MPEQVLENVYRIRIGLPNSPLKVLNSYFLKGAPRNLLIDTGFRHPDCKAAMLSALRELDADMADTDILLTHLHADHSGLASEIAKPETRLFISRREIPWMSGDTRRAIWDGDTRRMLASGFPPEEAYDERTFATSRAMASDPTFSRYLPIDEGDTFSCGGYTLRAVCTPGHTPGHMCFWMEEQKTLFAGDHMLFDITPNITVWHGLDDALGAYLDSLRKIDACDARLVLPGHREPGNLHERVKTLIAHHENRLDECFTVVCQNPGATVYELASKMTWKVRCSSWDEFPINQKWFAVGECHSHLRHLEALGKVRAESDGELFHYRAV